MATTNAREIKVIVQEHYAVRATEAAACSSPYARDPAIGAYEGIYTGTEMGGLPPEAIAASAGCGNPIALADLKLGEVVLDLGSGGGIDCFLAARVVGPEGRVLGIDITPEMVNLARRNADKLGLANVQFHLREMEDLSFESGSVDVVISNCVVCLSPDKDAVFREVLRVLKPGGRLHLSDMMFVGEVPQGVKNDPQRWVDCVAGVDQRETYLARLKTAGFQGIAIEEEQVYHQEPELENLRSVRVRAVKPV